MTEYFRNLFNEITQRARAVFAFGADVVLRGIDRVDAVVDAFRRQLEELQEGIAEIDEEIEGLRDEIEGWEEAYNDATSELEKLIFMREQKKQQAQRVEASLAQMVGE